MPSRPISKRSRSLLDDRLYQRLQPSTLDKLVAHLLQGRLGRISAAPTLEDLWCRWVMDLICLEGLTQPSDMAVISEIRLRGAVLLQQGQIVINRNSGVLRLAISQQTQLDGLIYLWRALRELVLQPEDKILPPLAQKDPEHLFVEWLYGICRQSGIPKLSITRLQRVALGWQLRRRRSSVVAARSGAHLLNPLMDEPGPLHFPNQPGLETAESVRVIAWFEQRRLP